MESNVSGHQQLLPALELPLICKDLSEAWTESVPVWYPYAVLDNSRLTVAEQLLQTGLYEAAGGAGAVQRAPRRAKAGQLLRLLAGSSVPRLLYLLGEEGYLLHYEGSFSERFGTERSPA